MNGPGNGMVLGSWTPLQNNPTETFPNPAGDGILAEDGDFLVTESNEHLITE